MTFVDMTRAVALKVHVHRQMQCRAGIGVGRISAGLISVDIRMHPVFVLRELMIPNLSIHPGPEHRKEWWGAARHMTALGCHGMVWQGITWQATAWRRMVWYRAGWHCMELHGTAFPLAGRRMSWHGMAGQGRAGQGIARRIK